MRPEKFKFSPKARTQVGVLIYLVQLEALSSDFAMIKSMNRNEILKRKKESLIMNDYTSLVNVVL